MTAFKEMAGRVAVVTGGASGIGKGIARRLKAEGMQLVLADIEPDALEQAAAELGAVGVPTDVSSFESVEALAAEVERRFGRVDLVCNNAGVGSTARIADMTNAIETWKNAGPNSSRRRMFLSTFLRLAPRWTEQNSSQLRETPR